MNETPTPPDRLGRPVPGAGKDDVPLASDTLVASAARRLVAFLIDVCLIAAFAWYVMLPFLQAMPSLPQQGHEPLSYIRTLAMAAFVSWCAYVVLFNTSDWQATPGQRLMRIYVCTVFGQELSLITATGRFIIFSAPVVILTAGGLEEIISVLPFIRDVETLAGYQVEVSEFFYPVFMGVAMIQFIMTWPLLTGNPSRVIWDQLFHTTVLQRDMRVS